MKAGTIGKIAAATSATSVLIGLSTVVAWQWSLVSGAGAVVAMLACVAGYTGGMAVLTPWDDHRKARKG